ncbi:MAG: response regulator [Deltaproteobacteria bacterium]|nr:response regulator [Deltaproteobacteria bacterium]
MPLPPPSAASPAPLRAVPVAALIAGALLTMAVAAGGACMMIDAHVRGAAQERGEAIVGVVAQFAGQQGGAAELSAALSVLQGDPLVDAAWILALDPQGELQVVASTQGAAGAADPVLEPAWRGPLRAAVGGPPTRFVLPTALGDQLGVGLPLQLAGAAGRPGAVLVRVNPQPLLRGVSVPMSLFLSASALMHVVLLIGLWRVIDGRLLRRLRRIAAQVQGWMGAHDLSGPPLGADHPDALGQLGLDLDQLRARFTAAHRAAQVARDDATASHAELSATLAAIPDELIEVSVDGVILAHRLPPGSRRAPLAVGRSVGEVLPAEAAQALRLLVTRAVAEGVAAGAPLSLPGPPGTRWMEPAAARRAGGAGPAAVVLLRDVTARLVGEAELHASEHRFRELFELSPVGIALADPATRAILSMNRAMERIIAPARPKVAEDLLVGVPSETILEMQAALRDAGRYGPIDLVVRPMGGRPVHLIASGVRVAEPSGRVVVWSMVQDVGERRAYEQQLNASKSALEDANRRLTRVNAELESTTLQLAVAYEQARKLTAHAEAASRAKSAFLARMSHEIRTPLNPIVGAGELLRGRAQDDEQRQLSDKVVKHGLKLLRLLSDVLLYAELQSDGAEPTRTVCRAAPIAEAALTRWGGPAREKGLVLRLVTEGAGQVELRTEPGLLGQALDQLLDNAIKFTPQGAVTLRLRAARGRVRFEVEDTGPGVNPDDLQRIFSAFEQADGGLTRMHGGAGLGLALCEEIARVLQGSVSGARAPSGGALFAVDLPESEGSSAPMLQLRRAAVVDPGAFGRAQLSMLLESWRCEVLLLSSLDEARAALEQEPHGGPLDVVFVAAEQAPEVVEPLVRLVGRLPGRPTLLMVGGPAPAPWQALPWVNRPVTPAGLYDRVAEALSARRPPPVSEAPSAPLRAATPTLLLVEDNIVNQQLAVMLLERFGYVVEVASDGAEALERLRAGRFALVLMDCMMPVMDGYACTGALRRGEAGRHNASLPVIAVTANAMKGDAQRCLDAGMDDYIAKPVRAEALRERVERWLGQRSDKAQV